MFHILGFIFFIILIVLLIGLFILSRVVGMIFGFKRRMQNGSAQRTTYSSSSNQPQEDHFDSYSNEGNTSVRRRKKIFDKEEGEYVDFEEIK